MKIKMFDETHEKDLEEAINGFIADKDVIDIKYQLAIETYGEEQIYCFTAMIIYTEK